LRRWTIAGGLILALGLIWAAFWWVAAGEMRDRAAAWASANSNDTTRISFGRIERAGFPLEVAADISDLIVIGDGIAASTPSIRVSLKPWSPTRLHLTTAGLTSLSGPKAQQLRIERVAAILGTTPEGRERLDLDLSDLSALLPSQPEIGGARLQIQASLKRGDPTPLTVSLNGTQLRASTSSERLDLTLEALWRGTLPSFPADLTAWRDGGGELELRDIAVTNGLARLSGSMILTLDESLRPLPKGTVTLHGIKPLLDRLTGLGVTSARDAAIGQVALTLLARPGADGQPEVTLPISGREGWLMIGPLRVTRIPSLQ
jgi:hypothetical protein